MAAVGRRAVLSMMAGGAVLAANRPGRSDSSAEKSDPRIRHIVVLMLENRSFDHMLGLLAPEVPGLGGVSLGEYGNVGIGGARYALTDGERNQGPLLGDPPHGFESVAGL